MMKFLIVVDMQNDFITGSLGSKAAEDILPAVCDKIRSYKNDSAKLFMTLDTHFKDYLSTSEGKKLPVEHCIKGTIGWEPAEEVANAIGDCAEVFEKNTFGSVKLAQTIASLAKAGDTVELCGLCTDICVVSNALLIKAFCPEVEVIIDAKCCAGVTNESHEAALATMRSCQCTIENF
nr:cysteine hydrolase [Ruminococcus sp.]